MTPARTHDPSIIPGGYLLCELPRFLDVWLAYRRQSLSYFDVRVYLGLLEVLHRRAACAAQDKSRRTVRAFVAECIAVDELLVLTQCPRRRRVIAAVRRLAHLGVVAGSDKGLCLPPGHAATLSSELRVASERARQLAPRTWVPIPRRLLRYLAAGAPAAQVAVAVSQLARCVFRHQDGALSTIGSCSAERIAQVFELHPRTVKAARAHWMAAGWLTRVQAPHWHAQRYGARLAVNLAWTPIGHRSAPRQASRGHGSAPTQGTGPRSVSGNQQPAPRVGSAGAKTETAAPSLRRLCPDDLRSPARLNQLHALALEAGWVTPCEADRLRFFASAAHARRVGTRNPCGLFVATLRRKRWERLTLADEEWARHALRRLPADDADRSTGGDQLRNSLGTLVAAVADALVLRSPSAAAYTRTAVARPAKNAAGSGRPAVRSSIAMTDKASRSESTLSARAA